MIEPLLSSFLLEREFEKTQTAAPKLNMKQQIYKSSNHRNRKNQQIDINKQHHK